MKSWKINQKFILVFIFLICFKFSKEDIDCSTCSYSSGTFCTGSGSCSGSCRPQLSVSSGTNTYSCYDCTGFSGYYTIIFDSNNPNGKCINACVGDKIIEETKECTSEDLSSLYKLGDFYYISDPSNGNTDTNIKCTNNICNCINYYYIKTIYGKKQYNCFDSIENPPSGYTFYS